MAQEINLDFFQLIIDFRTKMKGESSESCSNSELAEIYWEYLDSVVAASEEYGIDLFDGLDVPENQSDLLKDFDYYDRRINRYVTRSRVKTQLRPSLDGISLTQAERSKIRHLIDQIKGVLDSSGLRDDKKDAIHSILSKLLEEVEKDRTQLGAFADAVSGIAKISKDFAREGAEPWFKLLQPIFEILGAARERESQAPRLPAPSSPKRIEGPKKREGSGLGVDGDEPF